VIKAKILKHDVFRLLLAKTIKEFGYKHDGGLIIACDVTIFEHLLWLVEPKRAQPLSHEFARLLGLHT